MNPHKALQHFMIVITLLLPAACTPKVTPYPTVDAFHTAQPAPTSGSFSGISASPEGRSLFISIEHSQNCGAYCTCPVVEAARYPYNLFDDRLEIPGYISQNQQSPDWAGLKQSSGAIGIYTFYNVGTSDVQLIPSLPFVTPKGGVTISAMDASGAILVQMDYGPVRMEAGSSLSRQNVGGQDQCRILFTSTIFNHGFLDDSMVILD